MAELVETYPLFEWAKSNGSATAEQTQAAYTSVGNQGQCSDFSKLVWNDIVNYVGDLQTALGLTWDGKYTTMAGAKITAQYGALTAEKFNSVRHNIQAVAFTTWRWQFDYLQEGYVGRNDFRGVSTMGKDADMVYGWYILELVRKLNVAIELMRGTWPVAELEHVSLAETDAKAVIRTPKVAALPATATGFSVSMQALRVAGIAPVMGTAAAKSGAEGKLLAVPMVGLPATGNAGSRECGMLGLIPTRVMMARRSADTNVAAAMYPAPAPGFAYSKIHESYTKAEFVASMRSISLQPVALAQTKLVTEFRVPAAASMSEMRNIQSHVAAEFSAKDVEILAAVTKAAAGAAANLEALGMVLLYSAASSKSGSRSAAIITDSLRLAATGTGRTAGKILLIHLPPLPIRAAGTGRTAWKAALVPGVPRAIMAATAAESNGRGALTALGVTPAEGAGTGKSGATANLATCGLTAAAARETANSASKSLFMPMEILPVAGIGESVTASVSLLRTGTPLAVATAKTAESAGNGILIHRNPVPVMTVQTGITAAKAMAKAVKPLAVKAKERACSRCVAALEFLLPEKEWYDPVQTGSDLYIRQTYEDPLQDGENLDISEVYFEPVRDGSNLHIISLASLGNFGGE